MAVPQSLTDKLPEIIADIGRAVIGHNADPADERADRVATIALEEAYSYAPRAPETLIAEAATRYAGWLWASPANVRRINTGDPSGTSQDIELLNAMTTNGFRASGASALLSRYKRRRAGTIPGQAESS